MKNWLLLSYVYNFNPSLYNFLNFKFYHFQFCSKDDPTVTASLYIDNLAGEIKNEKGKLTSISKKSLTLAVIERILDNREAKQLLITLLEKKHNVSKDEIKQFLKQVNDLLNPPNVPTQVNLPTSINQFEAVSDSTQPTGADFPVRTYVIATHMYLQINNNELHYETLIRDTTALKEFITSKFKANRISGRIADMKSFSYKKILSGKNNSSAIGQLKPQIEQIALNPATFGTDVSAFAKNVLKDISASTH
jgi:hypothetical protein